MDALNYAQTRDFNGPVTNLRVTFWGVQGSFPISPRRRQVNDYADRVAFHTVKGLWERIRAEVIAGRPIADIFGGAIHDRSVRALQDMVPMPDLPIYGGETTCVEVEDADGNVIFVDAGSGLRHGSRDLLSRWASRANRKVTLLGTHEHLDHRWGLQFSPICFAAPPFAIDVYGPYGFLRALDVNLGVFSRKLSEHAHMDDPLDFRMMSAAFRGFELMGAVLGEPGDRHGWVQYTAPTIEVGKTCITPFPVYHGATPCVAYQIRRDNKTFVFCTDHEVRRGDGPTDDRQIRSAAAEAKLREMCASADLAYFDGQFFQPEYNGLTGIGLSPAAGRLGWGHGTIEDCIDRAEKCRIGRTLIGHHDPERDWTEPSQQQSLALLLQRTSAWVELARSDMVIDL